MNEMISCGRGALGPPPSPVDVWQFFFATVRTLYLNRCYGKHVDIAVGATDKGHPQQPND